MRAAILVPYRPGGKARTRNWKIARARLEELPWPIFVGTTRERFSRSRALNRAARAAGEWDVALIVDADIVLYSPAQAEAAVELAHASGAYTVAHNELRYLSEEATVELAQGRPLGRLPIDETMPGTWESAFAVRRDIWDQVGGFDERFVGYGFQGVAFFAAAGTLGGRARISGPAPAYHLAHTYVNRDAEPHFEDNRRLADRYLAAVDDPEAILAIVGESPRPLRRRRR